MKRPISIYPVAFWCFFMLVAQIGFLEDWLKIRLVDAQIPTELWRLISMVGGILAIWHIVRLIQLKAFNRWFSIAYLAWWTLMLFWKLFLIFFKYLIPTRPIVGTLAFCAINIGCIWYLGRKSFRQFCFEFVAEREKQKHSRMMQKISEKKLKNHEFS